KKKAEKPVAKGKAQKAKPTSPVKAKERDTGNDDEIPMLTQDMIDSRFSSMKKADSDTKKEARPLLVKADEDDIDDDKNVKLLDIALQKGTLNRDEIDKEKKRVRFFRDNFPGGEY
ncbi:MAG TPA: hypothetical protein VF857_05735, partial [Spirochaetota bacterium]